MPVQLIESHHTVKPPRSDLYYKRTCIFPSSFSAGEMQYTKTQNDVSGDKVGRKRAMLTGITIVLPSLFLGGFVGHYFSYILLRFVTCTAIVFCWVAAHNLVVSFSMNYTLCFNSTVLALGPVTLLIANSVSWYTYFGTFTFVNPCIPSSGIVSDGVVQPEPPQVGVCGVAGGRPRYWHRLPHHSLLQQVRCLARSFPYHYHFSDILKFSDSKTEIKLHELQNCPNAIVILFGQGLRVDARVVGGGSLGGHPRVVLRPGVPAVVGVQQEGERGRGHHHGESGREQVYSVPFLADCRM